MRGREAAGRIITRRGGQPGITWLSQYMYHVSLLPTGPPPASLEDDKLLVADARSEEMLQFVFLLYL